MSDEMGGYILAVLFVGLISCLCALPWSREHCVDEHWYIYECGEIKGPATRLEDGCVEFKSGDRICNNSCEVQGEVTIEAEYDWCGWMVPIGEGLQYAL